MYKRQMLRIAVFVSGGGTNLQALLDAKDRGEIPNGEFALVLSSREGVYALELSLIHIYPLCGQSV